MNLKQWIFFIPIIFIKKHIQCSLSITQSQLTKSGEKKHFQEENILNGFYVPANKTQIQQRNLNKLASETNSKKFNGNATTYNPQYQAEVKNIADLYFFFSQNVMGISNCSYENTIKINTNKNALLANGSYIYDNQTLVPPQLVGNYDYEILYNGTRRKVPQHKRACICHLKPCITLCNNDILKSYQYAINNGNIDALHIFSIDITQTNTSVVTKNIVNDFEHIVLNEFCESSYLLSPQESENSEWTLFENGSLLRHSDRVQLKRTEYCFDLYWATIDNVDYDLINPRICATNKRSLSTLKKFNYWTQVLSIIFLLLTIGGYCCLPELLDVHGKLLISYASNLSLSFAIFSFINLSQIVFDRVPCLLMAYFNHYLQLSHYTWLGIICYDIWRTCSDYSYNSSYLKYSLYGYISPFLMTMLTFVAQNLIPNETLKPGISEDRCGLDVYKWSAVLYLYGPCLIILLSCLTFFILTSRLMKTNDRKVCKFKSTSQQHHYNLYLRLLLMTVVSWFLEILSFALHMYNLKTVSDIIDYFNSLQGLYIFINFIVRGNVQSSIRKILGT